jgi:hypothetical protein
MTFIKRELLLMIFLWVDIYDRAIPLIEDHGKLSLVKKLF